MQVLAHNEGPCEQRKAVNSMQSVRKAARPMEGRTPNAIPYSQCRAVLSMQGRELNSGPQAWSASGLRRPCRAFNVRSGKKEEGAVLNKRGKRACLCHKFLLVLPLHSQRVALSRTLDTTSLDPALGS